MEAKHPVYTGSKFTWSGALGWAYAAEMGVPPGSTPHTSLPRKGVLVTGFWLRSRRTGRAMFFRLEETFPECWLYVSEQGIKLTVYND